MTLVRAAVVEDADAIGRIHVESWQHAYRGQLPQDFLDSLSTTRRVGFWRSQLQEPQDERRCWVADNEGVAIGFAATGPPADDDLDPGTHHELYAIYLDPSVWRHGIGSLLLEHVVADARERAFRALSLWVLESNVRARSFYERHGWKPDGATKQECIADVSSPAVRYRLPLQDRE